MDLALSLRAKGGAGLIARVGTILARFGPTPGRMERCLESYAEVVQSFGAQPTLPITARVLGRHPALIRSFARRGIEFAAHGLVHDDHAIHSLEEQRASIGEALGIFRKAGVACVGFRGPYLRYNTATGQVIRELGLRYHSSQAVAFPVLPEATLRGPRGVAYRRALDLYGALDARRTAVRPHERGGVVDIPVAVPDDEIMIDRLRLDATAQTSAWCSILATTHQRGELFTLQLHPERIFDMRTALRAVLAEARGRRPAVWIARLEEIADWWSRRGSGRLTVAEAAPGRVRIWLDADLGATLLVRGLPGAPAEPWHGADLVARERRFEVESAVLPVVGVSARTPGHVRAFLREEGFPVEESDDRRRYGAFVDHPADELDEIDLLDEIDRAPGPLARLWRWPRLARSALAVTGDIDSITLQDFALRLWETRR